VAFIVERWCSHVPSRHPQGFPLLTIELPHEQHKLALRSIERFFQEKMKEPIGNLAPEALREIFVNEIVPVLYN